MFYLHIRNGMNFVGGCFAAYVGRYTAKKFLNVSKCIGFDSIAVAKPGVGGRLYIIQKSLYMPYKYMYNVYLYTIYVYTYV